MKNDKPFNIYPKLCELKEDLETMLEGGGLPPDGESGQFLVSDGNGGAKWVTIGKAEEGEY